MKRVPLVALIAGAILSGPAWAHDSHPSKHDAGTIAAEEHAFGRQGDPRKITRTVKIDMADTMRYSPAEIALKRGETVRFEVTNSGKVMHEIVLGTLQDLQAHAQLMREHPGMAHAKPYMAHVAPGRTERLVWQFTRTGSFHYGCLVPGHFEAGMIGKVVVK